ncbi:eCIS core domain-containing protein [Halogeometricum limi]|uniref:eCIS core domain-containing protein n=1 Tax=Halogeometricum limi TaxID=555875 RepID=A0A1I6I3U0_9EURY|nr:DUF4157 domain-containing protein [Halogeometricum limi]SFR61294.1 protein of unknown function [Halogeometricum limi]
MHTRQLEKEGRTSKVVRSGRSPGGERSDRERAGFQPKNGGAVGRADRQFGNQAVQRLVRLRRAESTGREGPSPRTESQRSPPLCARCRRLLRAGKPLNCPDCERTLRRSVADAAREVRAGAETEALSTAIGSVSAGGRPLSENTRSHFERRFRHDFGRVRIHDGPQAARTNRRLNAEAFTVGSDIHFARGNYRPDTDAGRRLLAHELSHVVQQRDASRTPTRARVELGPADDKFEREAERAAETVATGGTPTLSRDGGAYATLRRFTRGERGQISNVDDVVKTAETLADETSLGLMRWGRFTAAAEGVGAWEALTTPESGSQGRLSNRYLFTCRCGLIDMRHFYQLMYIGVVASNETATEKGREHELSAEPQSRFAPEDTTSNALGAYFGSQQSWFQQPSTFVSNLRSFLQQCAPVDFAAMPRADQDTVVDFYAARTATGEPATPRETAVPDVLSVSVCATGDRSFPYRVEPSDEKTIRGRR